MYEQVTNNNVYCEVYLEAYVQIAYQSLFSYFSILQSDISERDYTLYAQNCNKSI
jgi:hypothetical protein